MLKGINEAIALPLLAQRPIVRQNSMEHASVTGKRVLVTGAGGSIGTELVLQIAASAPAELILIDHSEFNLYEVNATLDNSGLSFPVHPYLASIRDIAALGQIFKRHLPEQVFHAAALKHVPLLENDHNLIEAVLTNIRGTSLVAMMCDGKIPMMHVSTDKAVNPSSGMGLTKRAAEIFLQQSASALGQSNVAQVRFGNVVGSSGSVVPLFQRQIKAGGPVTITHPEMTRYLMSIKEAVGLTLDAADLQCEDNRFSTYVLDMGEPVKIIDLARQLVTQLGLRPEIDIPFEIIGPRPGEKLFEELAYPDEKLEVTPRDRVRRADASPADPAALNQIGFLINAAVQRNPNLVKQGLLNIVPSFQGDPSW